MSSRDAGSVVSSLEQKGVVRKCQSQLGKTSNTFTVWATTTSDPPNGDMPPATRPLVVHDDGMSSDAALAATHRVAMAALCGGQRSLRSSSERSSSGSGKAPKRKAEGGL
jgi:hypothetical protein